MNDVRATGICADGRLWLPPFHWLVVQNGYVFVGGLN